MRQATYDDYTTPLIRRDFWISKDGTISDPEEFHDKHLENLIRMIEREADVYQDYAILKGHRYARKTKEEFLQNIMRVYPILVREANRRNLEW